MAVWSEDLRAATPPGWMVELAEQIRMIEPGAILPTGVIVGSAVIEKVTRATSSGQAPGDDFYEWHLTDVERVKTFRKPRGHPQPVWFRPF